MVLKYYNAGLSARKISAQEDIWLSATSIVRFLRTQFSSDELENGRKKRISSTINSYYEDGSFDFVKEINAERSKTEEARRKNSEGVKKAWSDGKFADRGKKEK